MRFGRVIWTWSWRLPSTRNGCPRTSPSSWTATAGGRSGAACRAWPGTAPASGRCARTVETCARLGIKVLTLYAFSVENWKRPRAEIETLWRLLRFYLQKELPELQKNDIRLQAIGRLEALAGASARRTGVGGGGDFAPIADCW